MTRQHVLVVGSANVDVSVSTARLPRPGETVSGGTAMISVGGKGANQAVAAARCGARARFAACVGDDAFGRMVLDQLDAQGVDRRDVAVLPGQATGLATILVDAGTGQNCIAVAPGANALLDTGRIEALSGAIASAAVLVLQCETPMPAVYRAIEIAAAAGTRVILNPAPYRGLELERIAGRVDLLVPNETEAGQITGTAVDSPAAAANVARELQAAGVGAVIVTLGANGCVCATAAGVRAFAPFPVTAIDTTGAGDAFVGCLAAALAQGTALDAAIERAGVYAALSTTRRGAQASYGTLAELEQALAVRDRAPR